VLYYNTNFDGEISELILYNVTGDFDKYGIFIGLDPENATTYKYIINGTSGQVTYTTLESAELTEGPVGFVYKNGTLLSTYALTRLVVDSLGNNTIAAGTTKYPISDNVSVYVQTGDKYALSSLDKINTSKYKVTAYIDKAVALGGSIRVIIAEPIN
jgi:hypothetical protein